MAQRPVVWQGVNRAVPAHAPAPPVNDKVVDDRIRTDLNCDGLRRMLPLPRLDHSAGTDAGASSDSDIIIVPTVNGQGKRVSDVAASPSNENSKRMRIDSSVEVQGQDDDIKPRLKSTDKPMDRDNGLKILDVRYTFNIYDDMLHDFQPQGLRRLLDVVRRLMAENAQDEHEQTPGVPVDIHTTPSYRDPQSIYLYEPDGAARQPTFAVATLLHGRNRPPENNLSPLDIIAACLDEPGLRTTSRLSLSARSTDLDLASPDNTTPLLSLHLHTAVHLLPSFSLTWRQASAARSILFAHVFGAWTPTPPDERASVGLFYSALERAPVTRRGVPVEDGRATVEDALLVPSGLKPRLMPFQSRTVRWMLSREGVRVVAQGTDTEVETTGGKGRALDYDDNDMMNSSDEDEVEQERARERRRKEKGKARARDIDVDLELDGDGDILLHDADHAHDAATLPTQEEEDTTCELVPLSNEELRAQRRGPLWQREMFKLPLSNHLAAADDFREQEIFINRFCSVASVDDPGAVVKVKTGNVNDDHDGDEEEKEDTPAWCGANGLLAEEVGLGKTIEVLALIMMHQMPERNDSPSYHSSTVESTVVPTHMTLVIAPAAIIGQWDDEIERHTPSLRVLRYTGINQLHTNLTPDNVAEQYDIVLTTYDVLRREINIARKPHERALRRPRTDRPKYRRPLLIQLDFLRVIMDEAQMIGESASAVAETASLIPRKYSFAVTSTPLKGQVTDVQGLLAFLRVEPFVGSGNRATLQKLLKDCDMFTSLWRELGARTLKGQIQHELVIPEQQRFVVPVEFGPVEKYWYQTRYSEMMAQLHLGEDGTPLVAGRDGYEWEPNSGLLNRWLVSLRQACCHPQVGQAAKVTLGKTLKSIEEVLESMRDKAVSTVWSDQRQLFFTRVKRAQLECYDIEDCERFENALETLQSTLLDLKPVMQAVSAALKVAWKECKERRSARKKHRASASDDEREESDNGDDADDDNSSTAGSNLDLGDTLGLGVSHEEASKSDHRLSEKDKAGIAKLGALRNRLRELIIVEHNALFFSGSAYFNMGKFPDEETECYRQAERLRQSILKPYEREVTVARDALVSYIESRDKEDELDALDLEFQFNKYRGLQAQEAFEDCETTIDILNGYAELLWQWRDSISKMLETGVEMDEDATGDEYASRAEMQEKLNCYLEAYEVLLQEWRYGINGEQSLLADQLMNDIFAKDKKGQWAAANPHEKRRRKKDYIPLAKRRVPTLEQGDTPEDVLRFELLVDRVAAKGEGQEEVKVVPLQTVQKNLKEAAEDPLNEMESALLTREAKRLREETSGKAKIADRLRNEHVKMTEAMNARLTYFKQLQMLSDEVADPEFNHNFRGFPTELRLLDEDAEKLEAEIDVKSRSSRYLNSLAEGHSKEVDTTCVICSEIYTKGVLTKCGHLFCHDCFTAWHARSKTCSLCKEFLRAGDWEVVNYKRLGAAEVEAIRESGGNADSQMDTVDLDAVDRPVRLATIDEDELAKIEAIETVAPLSSKSDMIVKHVKHIRRQDPLAKVVIFSAWTESLQILMQAFFRNSIEYVRLEQAGANKREGVVRDFVENPSIAAFFLHTKSQSAGLNLTCAQYVFLVEPLLHPSLEIQAVARVHRIGQQNQTQVFQYYVNDSVDQRVAEWRARAGTSLFLPTTKVNHAKEAREGQRDLGSASLKHRSGKNAGGDEVMEDEDDLLRCLFAPDHYMTLQRSLLPVNLRPEVGQVGAPPVNGEVDGEMEVEPLVVSVRHSGRRASQNGANAANGVNGGDARAEAGPAPRE